MKRPLYFSLLLLAGLLSIFSIYGCGGGNEFTGTSNSVSFLTSPASSDCLGCHPTTKYTNTPSADTGSHLDNAATTSQIEGYILNTAPPWVPEGQGYVSKSNPDACAASCHNYHNSDMAVNRQWAESGHADITSPAFNRVFSGACVRCHSGIGFANYVGVGNTKYPGWTAPVGAANLVGHHLTCNACHDAQGYPTASNKRLRKTGITNLISGTGTTMVYDAALNVGASATCISCHQARESGGSIFKQMVINGATPYDATDDTIPVISFVNPHYAAAGALLFSLKGFEYNGLTYTTGNVMHQTPLCTGCHMAGSNDEDLGGHTFAVRTETGRENVDVCERCHGPVESLESVGGISDVDGDNLYGYPKDEIKGLKNLIIANLASAGIIYNSTVHPYFFKAGFPHTSANGVKTWKESQLEAAFNLKLIAAEPGAYAHNFKYAAQLLRDSYAIMTGKTVTEIKNGTALPGSRPTGNERPATKYTP
ncbi:MAG: hypothetical protein Q8J64_00330 [Thermodesulfovibrionales bacterium]|nr:hypothetical protein [Thermodesulfovibrionales bacterium]